MIIGLVGYRCAGKGEVVKILKGEGFKTLGFGDEVRLERDARLLPRDEDLHEFAVKLRTQFGPQYWASRVAGRMDLTSGNDYVIDGMRTLKDLESFNKFGDFYLVGVNASLRTRFSRSANNVRGRLDDTSNYEDFVRRDQRDRSSEEGGLQSEALFKRSHYLLQNEGDLETLRTATLQLLEKLKSRK